MINESKIRRKTVDLHSGASGGARPSRIRRDPVRAEDPSKIAKKTIVSEEREIWGGVAGIVLIAIVLAVATVGISAATILHDDPAAAHSARFGQCYNAGGADCVVDGDTIYLDGGKVQIAGMEAPRIQGAQCDEERSRGIAAAVQLADLLSSGKVAAAGKVRGPDGQVRTKVEVNGRDVGAAMINAGAARDPASGPGDWCSSDDQ